MPQLLKRAAKRRASRRANSSVRVFCLEPLERSFPMFNRPPRFLRECGGRVLGLGCRGVPRRDDARHHVKTLTWAASSPFRMLVKPGHGAAPQSVLFPFVHGFRCATMTAKTLIGSSPTCFDFNEEQSSTLRRDQIDLDPRGSNVLRDDLIPSLGEEASCLLFTFASECLSMFRHAVRVPSRRLLGSARTWDRGTGSAG